MISCFMIWDQADPVRVYSLCEYHMFACWKYFFPYYASTKWTEHNTEVYNINKHGKITG